MTRAEIEAGVYRRLNKNAASVDAQTQTRIREFLNSRHRALLTSPGLSRLRDATLVLTSEANRAGYSLGPSVAQIYRIADPTNRWVLEERSLNWYRTADPDPETGTPLAWINLGYQAVERQPSPSTGSTVWVDSSSASDTGTITVTGITLDGTRRTVSTTMTGTTAKEVSTVVFAQITDVSVSAAAVGEIVLLEGSGTGAVLARIEIGRTAARSLRIALWPTPSAAVTYAVDVQRALLDLSGDTDVPALPEDFHAMLIDGVCAEECLHKDDPRASLYEQRWQQQIAALYRSVHGRIVYGEGGVPQRSSLGSWFPAGS